MQRANPQLSAVALLVRKFGERIPGGFEVRVTASEMVTMSPHGTFQEVPDIDGRGIRWQYFPNITIDIEGHVVPDDEPKKLDEPEKLLPSESDWENEGGQ